MNATRTAPLRTQKRILLNTVTGQTVNVAKCWRLVVRRKYRARGEGIITRTWIGEFDTDYYTKEAAQDAFRELGKRSIDKEPRILRIKFERQLDSIGNVLPPWVEVIDSAKPHQQLRSA